MPSPFVTFAAPPSGSAPSTRLGGVGEQVGEGEIPRHDAQCCAHARLRRCPPTSRPRRPAGSPSPPRASPSRARPAASTAATCAGCSTAIGLIQIDSVNVLVRSQELPLFARLGPHPRTILADAMAATASCSSTGRTWRAILPTRPPACAAGGWSGTAAARGMGAAHAGQAPAYVDEVLDPRARPRPADRRRPRAAASARRAPGGTGTTARRRSSTCSAAGVVGARGARATSPAATTCRSGCSRPASSPRRHPTEADGPRRSCSARRPHASASAPLDDLADYYRQLKPTPCKPLVAELVGGGRARAGEVDGWDAPAYLHRDARSPRCGSRARALLSPFDSLVWYRERTERLFGFHYRIEIYTPAPKRVYGYYVLPFLLGDHLVGRVDLKADRAGGRAAGAGRLHRGGGRRR